jgi:hypothetical protein|tara:strand:- start:4179 stop:4790 length:612 start_codon:yes stop_codon:yes gene_type:complete
MARRNEPRPVGFQEGIYLAHATTTLAANLTLTVSSPQIQNLDPAADRTVTLPAVGSSDGLMFYIANKGNALELITVQNAGATKLATIGPGESATFVCDGSTWNPHGKTQGGANIETLAATHVLVATSPEIQTLDPGGAGRDVTLPAAAVGLVNRRFKITNTADAAEDLTVKDAADTIITVSQNEVGAVWCDGTTWYGHVGAVT